MPNYKLPELRYDYGALEPHISGKILALHHQKHHAGYVKAANEAIEKLDDASRKQHFDSLPFIERTLAFNLSGHVLHSIFFRSMKPKAEKIPEGALALAIDDAFGSFDGFKNQLIATASTIMGAGWGALVWEPIARRLVTTQIYDHQSNLSQCGVPIMVIDAWEHAYYLQYQDEKKKFFEAIWHVWDWSDISRRFDAARAADLGHVLAP